MASRYAAFLSYSHSADRKLAAIVQRALPRLGEPWYRRATLQLFHDDTSLAANPGLWTSIERNLAQSDYLLLLASRDAAGSPWVAKEIQWWRDHREAETLLIVVTLAAPIPAKAPAKSCRRASPSRPMRSRARSDLLSPYMRGK